MLGNIEKVWREFAARPFPDDCAGMEVEGIELASLDTSTAGCIDTFVSNSGRLDAERVSILRRCTTEIDAVVPLLEGDAMDYFEQLQMMSQEVLRFVAKGERGH